VTCCARVLFALRPDAAQCAQVRLFKLLQSLPPHPPRVNEVALAVGTVKEAARFPRPVSAPRCYRRDPVPPRDCVLTLAPRLRWR